MAPEQASAARLDRRTDVFAAGILLHEVLTGQRLFRPRTEAEAVQIICESPIPRPSTRRAEVSPALEAVVMCALDRDRERRFASAAQFLEELEAACRPASSPSVTAWVQRRCGDRLAERRQSLAKTLVHDH
jgi:serine/threonine-protein kinase